MKRTLVLALVAIAALALAGFAVAHGLNNGANAKAVAGTFSATTASHVETRTCTTTDGKTLVATTGTYTGTAAGDADLTGPATLRSRSLINSTDGIGTVSGTLRIDTAAGGDTLAHFDAVYSAGQIAGLASGHAHDPHVRLIGNLSSAFDASTGFTNGKVGGGTSGGAAVELGPGQCKRTAVVKEDSRAVGLVSAVSSSSITVAGLTCTVPANLQALVSPFAVGAHVEIRCALTGGVNTLVAAHAKGK